MKNERVRYALFKSGISQRQLAERLNTTSTDLSYAMKWELADSEQDKLVKVIEEMVEDRSRCSGN